MSDTITSNGIDLVLGLAPAKLLTIDEFTFIDKDRKAEMFEPPVPSALTIHTLSGFVKLLEGNFEAFTVNGVFVQVSAFDEVSLSSNFSDQYGRRQIFVTAKALQPERTFQFNTFMAQENFNIALRSMFVQDDDLDALVKLAGNIAHNTEARQEDDGFSQTVSAKAGVHLRAEYTIKPRVILRPFRTFLEVEQPTGEFIFRVKNSETEGNKLALFEADAGRWKLTAMDTIATWLRQKITTSDVASINALPVVC